MARTRSNIRMTSPGEINLTSIASSRFRRNRASDRGRQRATAPFIASRPHRRYRADNDRRPPPLSPRPPVSSSRCVASPLAAGLSRRSDPLSHRAAGQRPPCHYFICSPARLRHGHCAHLLVRIAPLLCARRLVLAVHHRSWLVREPLLSGRAEVADAAGVTPVRRCLSRSSEPRHRRLTDLLPNPARTGGSRLALPQAAARGWSSAVARPLPPWAPPRKDRSTTRLRAVHRIATTSSLSPAGCRRRRRRTGPPRCVASLRFSLPSPRSTPSVALLPAAAAIAALFAAFQHKAHCSWRTRLRWRCCFQIATDVQLTRRAGFLVAVHHRLCGRFASRFFASGASPPAADAAWCHVGRRLPLLLRSSESRDTADSPISSLTRLHGSSLLTRSRAAAAGLELRRGSPPTFVSLGVEAADGGASNAARGRRRISAQLDGGIADPATLSKDGERDRRRDRRRTRRRREEWSGAAWRGRLAARERTSGSEQRRSGAQRCDSGAAVGRSAANSGDATREELTTRWRRLRPRRGAGSERARVATR
ncbi:hypothetical protein Scep_019524 [Stephania cephalantha]|uniref:Uncharacterized protein n=1 Tax=Stephania cephalantha TaxID=152367 RepID=A0AAP0IBC1_9MAGN